MSKKDRSEVLQEFRAALVEQDLIHDGDTIGTDDHTLLRFLRARGYNVKHAIAMWKKCQEWRKTVEGTGIDELYRQIDPWDYPERDHVFDCWPLWFHKTDKKGRPINIHHFAGINMPELYKHISPERHWQTIVVNAESLTREVLPASSRAAGKHIDGTFVIVDLKGFGVSQFWQMKHLAHDSFQISQDYFPETMAKLAIVNAPMGFSAIWSFMRPWLAKETAEKVDILGSNYKSVLLDLIDPENLPESLGGTCTCEGLGGCKMSNAGPWMEDRQRRRERWLKGEGPLIDPEDASQMQESSTNASLVTVDTQSSDESVKTAQSSFSNEGGAEGQETENVLSGSTSESSLPSTPPAEDKPGNRTLSRDESLKKVYEEHPETRQVQAGDLHAKETSIVE